MDLSQDKSNDHSEQAARKVATDKLSILVISGLSGSGKTSVLNILEDLGYYSIDNLPLSLLANATHKLINESGIRRIALGVDIRTPRADLSNFAEMHESLKAEYGDHAVKVVYVTAQENTLVARFNATRRVHPLMSQDVNDEHAKHVAFNLPAAIKREIELLEPIADHADVRVDTSDLNIHQLKDLLREYIGMDNQIVVNLLSFGFKYGSPIDADFVFDVRILPNPHWNRSCARQQVLMLRWPPFLLIVLKWLK